MRRLPVLCQSYRRSIKLQPKTTYLPSCGSGLLSRLVLVEIGMSVLVSLAQVCSTFDWRKPKKQETNQTCYLI